MVVDLSLSGGDLRGLLVRVGERSPGSKVLMLYPYGRAREEGAVKKVLKKWWPVIRAADIRVE